ncbi:acyl-CoA thioesterase [Bacillus sp. Marseille-P3661]|uniref:acyl-CoA thioesterase n=1 Tax=Bacillus sp. Marseille-P3661 TaxID=1936234 RepID=UPI000C8363A5|nr:thioesterase family protein [Bacillus sp. Marseille-P3661]
MNEYRFDVKWGATDAAGIVFYPNFYKWMDEATHNLFVNSGYQLSKLFAEESIGIPLLEANCQFKSPLRFEDYVTVRTSIREIRNKVLILDHVFSKRDIEVAIGYEVRAWTRFGTIPKAEPVPLEIQNALGYQKSSI